MSKVVVLKLDHYRTDQIPDSARYKQLLTVGLKLISGKVDASSAVAALVPDGVVGIKTNCLTPKVTHTPVALVDALADLLTLGGKNENDLIIWERSNRELSRAGYQLNASSFGRRCLGTDSNGVGYSRNHYLSGNVGSMISRVLTEMVDYNINLPVLKDHSIAGLSASLKNMYGAIHNPNKYHDNNCDPYAAQVNDLEPIRRKNVLTIIDATNVQYHGGPGLDQRYLHSYGAVMISTDPVAADTIALEILEHLRKVHKLKSLAESGRPANYLKSAQSLGLGVAQRADIDLQVQVIDSDGDHSEGSLF